jgi:benzoyl-CoA reductase subunit C
MLTQLRELYDISPSQNESLKRWKREGKKAFGYICTNIPEEMIYAAGILPIRILGAAGPIFKADRFLATFVCHPMRSMLEMGLNGEFADLDGMVMAYSCEGGKMSQQVLIEKVGFPCFEYCYLPHIRIASSYTFYRKEIAHLKATLEKFIGKEIGDESLSQAIKVYNENRSLLTKVYDLRGEDGEPKISGSEAAEIVLSSMLMPKEEHNRLLSQLIANIPQRKDLPKANGPRIHVCGTMLPPDLELFNLVEDLGGMVVSDDLCMGSRYFRGQVDTSLEPLEALTKYYLDTKAHCPYVYADETWTERVNNIKEMVNKYKADGVVVCSQRWCDHFLFHRPFLLKELEASRIPVLSIEVERAFDRGAVRTRLEAFFEMMGGTK